MSVRTKGGWRMPKTYTTILGDMWDMIAQKTLGSGLYTDALMKSNLQYRHIFIFSAGITLTIPDVPVKAADSLPPWKRGDVV